jgi:hypothetical protein
MSVKCGWCALNFVNFFVFTFPASITSWTEILEGKYVCVVKSSQNVFPDFSVYVEIFWQSVVLLGGIIWGKEYMMSFRIVLLLFKLERHTLCFFFFLSLTLLFKFKNQWTITLFWTWTKRNPERTRDQYVLIFQRKVYEKLFFFPERRWADNPCPRLLQRNDPVFCWEAPVVSVQYAMAAWRIHTPSIACEELKCSGLFPWFLITVFRDSIVARDESCWQCF